MTFTIEYDDSLGQISCIVETLRRAWIVFQFLCFQLFLSDFHLIIMIDTKMILWIFLELQNIFFSKYLDTLDNLSQSVQISPNKPHFQ